MAVITQVEPIARDIDVLLHDVVGPAAQSAQIASVARIALQEGEQQNRLVLGRVPPHKTFVDAREGASEDEVRPDGTIVYEFALVGDVLRWISIALEESSPIGSGRDPHPGLFQKSHTIFANGKEVDLGGVIPAASEFVFVNRQPYARKIERGQSKQFPDGVFHVIAVIAAGKFGNIASITFAFRAPIAGQLVGGRVGNRADERTPAIIVKLR